MRTIKYETRDGEGKDIVKDIEIKKFPLKACGEIDCPVCGKKITQGVYVKDAVSSNFTDWNRFGDTPVVCNKCAALFSVYPYSYIYTPDSGVIRLLNIRQIEDALVSLARDYKHRPLMFCISTSQKKHLFYKAKMNRVRDLDCSMQIAVNLEEETIYTTLDRQSLLFKFIESLQILGTSKSMAARGEISFETCRKLKAAGFDIGDVYEFLQNELQNSREIQIALYASQMPIGKKDVIEMHEQTAYFMLNYAIQTGGEIPKL